MKINRLFLFNAVLCSFFTAMIILCNEQKSTLKKLREKIESSMVAAAWGDVLGGVTEFHSTPSELFLNHPDGVLSIDNFAHSDWSKFPAWYFQKGIAPYTDDTAMALVVADYCLGSSQKNLFDDEWIAGMASAFIDDMNNPYGWMAPFRAPGLSTMKALELLSKNKKTEWPQLYKKFEDHQGCGSIMRAYPCGLLFWNNLLYVQNAAIAQSRVTHNSSIANASCAALSMGIGVAMRFGLSCDSEVCYNRGNGDFIVGLMSSTAGEVDRTFAVSAKIDEGYQAGKHMESLLTQHRITTPEQLIEELKKETSEVARYHFDICKKFPGWKADDALAAAVYSVSAAIKVPYLAIILGVHSTGDSDSVASLAGALIGAWHGKKALPINVWEKEVLRIEEIDTIKAYAKQIYTASFSVV